jgi:hypothetical protein
MKRFLFTLVALLSGLFASAQTPSNIKLDSLHLTTRNPNVNDDSPVSVFDTSYVSRQVELNAFFYVGNIWELDSIEIKYGTTQGASDIFDFNFEHIAIDSIAYIKSGNIQIPVINGQVYFTYLIPEHSLQKPDYIWIRARDTKGQYSNILIDKN